ncbi:MAG: M28 family peptidase [Armatimonadota bacterium]|nr:M28 family peptidase [Armatimonadota bacterium]
MTSSQIRLILCLNLLVLVVLAGCTPAQQIAAFDGERAYQLLKFQVDLGPRYPGSSGHKAAHEMIFGYLKKYASTVETQEFRVQATNDSEPLVLKNIIALFDSKAKGNKDYVLLAAHWDTRPTADCEVTAEDQKKPILGANDGASGTAVLLEMARVLHHRKPPIGVVMVFFDGEDYGPTSERMFLGSRYFAENLERSISSVGKSVNIRYGVLLDMVGDRNLMIYREGHSVDAAPEVVDKVWTAADELGYGKYFGREVKYTIEDDHVPLIKAGIKCIDVIDFDYAAWHTLDDTPDKCSPKSLQIVGRVVERVIYSEKP